MMAIAFLLKWIDVVINGQAIADQDSGKVLSQHADGYGGRTALNDDVKGQHRGREHPQPPSRSTDPPTGFIGMQHRTLAHLHRHPLILWLHFATDSLQEQSQT